MKIFSGFSYLLPGLKELHHAKRVLDLPEKSREDPAQCDFDGSTALPEVPTDLDCSLVGKEIQSHWLEEVQRAGQEKASLSQVIFRTIIPDLISQVLLYIICRVLIVLALFEAVYGLLSYLEDYDLEQKEGLVAESASGGGQPGDTSQTDSIHSITLLGLTSIDPNILQYLMVISLATITRMSSFSWLTFGGLRIGLKCRAALTSLIQMKSLRINLYEQSNSLAIELITNEVTFIEEASRYISFAFGGFICIVCTLLWLTLRVLDWRASLAALFLVSVFLVLKWYQLKVRKRTNRKRRAETNKRIEATGTFLSSIKVIKMYAWELPFRNRIQAFRDSELKHASTIDLLTILDLAIFVAGSRILAAVPLLVVIFCRAEFTLEALFIVPLCFQSLSSDYILLLARGFQSLEELASGCANIKKYLLIPEKNDQRRFDLKYKADNRITVFTDLCISNELERLEIQTSPEPKPTPETNNLVIENLTADFRREDLVIVIGRVGSGKSTFLRAMLGEARIAKGNLRLKRGVSVSYASQESWILSESFRSNILFGRPFNGDRYKAVIEACSLEEDLKRFPQGDETCIGPRGVSLSGGQKARLNLARAVYSEADVYLLDDPLSAVDTRVAQHIVNRCIKQLLGNKLVVLATHQLQFVDCADKIVYLEPGQQAVVGPVQEILKIGSVQQFVSSKSAQSGEPDHDNSAGSDTKPGLNEKVRARGQNQAIEATQSSKPVKKRSSSSYVFFLKLGISGFSFTFFLFNAALNGPLLTYVTYYYRQWSRNVFQDMHDPSVSETEFFQHLYRSWFTQAGIIAISVAHLFIYATHLARSIRNCSRQLHNKLVTSLFHAKMSFYDYCCAGEFTSRYAASFALIDHLLLYSAVFCISYTILILSSCIMLGVMNLYASAHILCSYLVIFQITRHYVAKIIALTGMSRSLLAPTLTTMTDMMEDLSTIRSDGSYLEYFQHVFNTRQNRFTSMNMLKLSFQTWVFFTAKLSIGLSSFVLLLVVFSVYRADMDVSTAGCVILLLQSITALIPTADDYASVMQTAMGGVDKVRQYTELEPEEGSGKPSSSASDKIRWLDGGIEFESVTLRYFAKGRPVLDQLSFSIAGGEHVGVVGRTGAGKSSILSVLFRLYSYEGRISIDGRDIRSIPLGDLRASLSVIPQDPVLFCASLRHNLDPFGQYSDEQIWRALEVVKLSDHVAEDLPARLEHQISEGGRNFSVGQRQLVCLARAILKASKVLLIDEATANVDLETDSLIQLLIRKQFASSTVITIAHRLETVLDYDRIMVLDDGRIAEFDTVERLRSNEGGLLNQMLKASSRQGL